MALAAAAVAAVVLLVLEQPKPLEYKLPDGSVLRVEKVSIGKRESFKIGGPMRVAKGRVTDWLAKRWPSRYTASSRTTRSWNNNVPVHTNTDALNIWLTRRDAATGKYLDVGYQTAQLTDEHGCIFMATRAGGYEDGLLGPNNIGGYSVGWFSFEAFPRHEKNLRFLLRNNGTRSDTDLTIPNPIPPPGPVNWTVEPLPITKQDGDVAFTLTGVKLETYHTGSTAATNRHYIITPSFEVREKGQLTQEWEAMDLELYDGSGNFAWTNNYQSLCLCPWESVWKLRVRFFGSEQSASASNSVWKISGVKVPGEGEFVALDATNEVQGVAMKVIALAGSGKVTYSNGKVTQASAFENGKRANSMSTGYFGNNNYTIDLASITPHLALEIGVLSENQRLTLRATDDQGRQVYAQDFNARPTGQKEIYYVPHLNSPEPNILILDLPKDAKTVDLSFCIHNARTEEFIFKPPTPEKH